VISVTDPYGRILKFLDTSKKVGLVVNKEKSKCVLMPHHQNTGKNHDIKIANRLK
jgi:hypothetical protein